MTPLLPLGKNPKPLDQPFPGWPTQFAQQLLQALPLNQGELRFEQAFPGRLGKFSDGTREIALRWVTEPTRMLHPASDCLQGLGYTVKPQPLWVDNEGQRWGCVLALRRDQTIRVRERIYDAAGHEWTDVSSWYWAATFGQTAGPWWAVTVAERP
ncbi:MAG TPA: hypothetical protein VFZ34_02950 [Blastocatellia bacterium]|nr:hypothetical protein [Blastocatellia bacterium]